MRAQVLTEFGGPERLELRDVPRPEVRPGTVLVRIAAAAVNQVDLKIREGLPIGPALPAILGADLAGTVEAVGDGVTDLRPGDEVYGCAGGVRGHGGTLAEWIVADARLVAPKPQSLSMRDAAALPLVAITAWEALERAQVSARDHVLVHGGAGGVGHVGVQLAKARGARVAATVGAEDADVVRELGADEAVLFREEAVADYVGRLTQGRGFDVVFDTIGGPNLAPSFAAAASGGRVATTNARTTADLSPLHAKALSLHVVFMLLPMLEGPGREAHGRILREVAALVDAGRLRPLVDPARFTLETAPDAHRHLASGAARGKVVVEIG
ncbi:zinc-dependent alcohol dehydrogenase family protein [Geothrix sp. 21YS21S-4]|uniref:zinc-dependent alcohol dehydrogenase family protein n=1 Tax=Geothrix sp. 21YS21S-4 TaxID=3068889 RepID=UPI0027BA5319|nr:zinc-dependent alcohol dehydrogenase family protein [Geothrix sp. 21YS21S-4]